MQHLILEVLLMAAKVAPEEFWRLLRSGMQVIPASAAVGVSSWTGYRWLHQAGGPAVLGLTQLGRSRPWGGRHPESARDRFWDGLCQGETVKTAAEAVGVSEHTGHRWLREAGGVKPRVALSELEATVPAGTVTGPLQFLDRVRIETMLRARYSPAEIARVLGRSRSTISRELPKGRAKPSGRYRAVVAQTVVDQNRARTGRTPKLTVEGTLLFDEVVARLKKRHSPEQIANRLRRDFPDRKEMWVSHETIYQALYVQPRGGLAAAVGEALRTGRSCRKSHGRAHQASLRDMVMIADRPAEVDDRAVPGHWEGDLIIGSYSRSAIGTLVERTTGFTILLHLPDDHTAATVATAMQAATGRLPEHLWRSLTWDQGSEMALHTKITELTGLPVYFCNPHSPWERGTNENTNGLLRQYFPKGTDLSVYGPGILDEVAAELNARPRKRLDWDTPAERLELLLNPTEPVASTA